MARLKILTALLTSAAGTAIAQSPSARQILDKMTETYTHVSSIHVVGERQDTLTKNGQTASGQADLEIAARGHGQFFARLKRSGQDAIAVSDGENTWKALPSKKQWSQLAASASGDGDEGSADAPDSRDLHTTVTSTLFGQYLAIAKAAPEPELVKEEEVKLGGVKVPCYVVRTRIKSSEFQLWIDRERFLVLQSKQKDTSGASSVETRVKAVVMEINKPIDDSRFHFEPGKGWSEVEMLLLPGEESMLLTGSRAGNFSLKTLNGEPIQLDETRGKVVVLDFWATWCPPCRKELPSIEKLKAEFADKVQFYGVNDEESGTVKDFIRKNHYELAVLMDGKRQVHRQYGVSAIPTLLIIDRQGVIRQHFIGSRAEATLRQAIESVLASR